MLSELSRKIILFGIKSVESNIKAKKVSLKRKTNLCIEGNESISLHFDAATTKSFLILFFRRKIDETEKKRVKKETNVKIIREIHIIIVNDNEKKQKGLKEK